MADPFEVELDLQTFTLGELERLESVSGRTAAEFLSAISGEDFPAVSAKDLIALALVSGQRRNPVFSESDARNVRVEQLSFVVGSQVT